MATWKGTVWDYAGYRQAQRRWREQIALPDSAASDAPPSTRTGPPPMLLTAGVLAILLHAAAFDWLPVRFAPLTMPPLPQRIRIQLALPAKPLPTAPMPSKPAPAPDRLEPIPSAAKRPPRMQQAPQPKITAAPRMTTPQPSPAPSAARAKPAEVAPHLAETAPVPTQTQAAPAPARPPAAAAPDTAARADADYLRNPAPDYPEFALSHGWGGRVLLHVHVLADGHPDQVEVQRTSGHKLLDEAAQRAVQGWSFVPARHGGAPVDSWVVIPVEFNTVKGSAS